MRKLWGYIRALFGYKTDQFMNPKIQLEQAMRDARQQDSALEAQVAKVVAHRTEVALKLERAVKSAAQAEVAAKVAVTNLTEAEASGDEKEIARWNASAQTMAVKLEAEEQMVDELKAQLEAATNSADHAKGLRRENAMRLEQLAAQKMKLLGKIEQANMQKEVNKTLKTLEAPVGDNTPTFLEMEDKVNALYSAEMAKAELDSESLSGTQRQIQSSIMQQAGADRLAALRADMKQIES